MEGPYSQEILLEKILLEAHFALDPLRIRAERSLVVVYLHHLFHKFPKVHIYEKRLSILLNEV